MIYVHIYICKCVHIYVNVIYMCKCVLAVYVNVYIYM